MSTGGNFKNNLSAGGSPFDKAKMMRRPTPDSDVVASSDDEQHITPSRAGPSQLGSGRRPSSSWLQDIPNRKNSLPPVSLGHQEHSVPARSATMWNLGSFTNAAASPTRLKEVLSSPTSAQAPSDKSFSTPSTEGEDTVGFLLNQHGVRKSVRSQSYSVGQGESDSQTLRLRSALRHRPSKPSLLNEAGAALGRVREDDNDEADSSGGSQHGISLANDYWEREAVRPAKGLASKQVTIDTRPYRSIMGEGQPRRLSLGMRTMTMNDVEDGPEAHGESFALMPYRRFSEHVGSLGQGEAPNQDYENQGWAGSRMHNDALARRHSFAHPPSNNTSAFSHTTLDNTQEEDEEASPLNDNVHVEDWDTGAYFSGIGPVGRSINSSNISAAHPAPPVAQLTVNPHNAYANPTGYGRQGRRIYVVQFKCSRSDIYYLYENTGLEIRVGDLVIVEGDRGHDLGQVTKADVSMDEAKRFKNEANEDHFRWLCMFSQYSVAGASNKNRMLGALYRAHDIPPPQDRMQLTVMGVQQDPDCKPRMIRRLAQQHEILQLRDKEGEEARAKRMATEKAYDLGLPMEMLDAEFQWDHHKISFFYYAEAYVDFKALVTDLFKHYKIRIWMSAVNPASVVNPAGMQVRPPSGIGPGAIVPSTGPSASLTVGPLVGNNSYQRSIEQYGGSGRNRGHSPFEQPNYFPFSHQVPAFPGPGPFPMHTWGHAAEMYGQMGANRSPMNMGAFYPPTTYAASPAFNQPPSAASFRGGYPATSGPGFGGLAPGFPPHNGLGGFSTSSTPGHITELDPGMIASFASFQLGGNNTGGKNAGGDNTGSSNGGSNRGGRSSNGGSSKPSGDRDRFNGH